MQKESCNKPNGLMHKRCCLILGVVIPWWVICILHFSSSNTTQFAYGIFFSKPSSKQASHGSLDSSSNSTQFAYKIPSSMHSSKHASHSTLDSSLDSTHFAHGISSSTHPSNDFSHHSTLDSYPLKPFHSEPSNFNNPPKHNLFSYNHSLNDALPLDSSSAPCLGKLIYIHQLPKMYNEDLLPNCSQFNSWEDICKLSCNDGLGPKLEDNTGTIISNDGWFATNQFALELIFHKRMKHYKCLTQDSSKAALVYVPFYAGLDISRFLWGGKVSERDNLSMSLAAWLRRQDEWKVMGGRDHFMVCGRMTWDFRRAEGDWGNKLLRLDVMQNMSTMLIDKSPWHDNDYAIPYPTYFHPHNHSEVIEWQERVRKQERPALFSFAGAPRETMKDSIRGEVIQQCKGSRVCTLLECGKWGNTCHSPLTLMRLFQESVFCLQPRGDSATRRSIFDSMLAGCIPVFFHPHSAYIQYIWHLPHNQSEYSVYIPEDDVKAGKADIESVLKSIPPNHAMHMRERIISLIPTLIYANPSAPPDFEDAFDVAIQALARKVARLRSQGIHAH